MKETARRFFLCRLYRRTTAYNSTITSVLNVHCAGICKAIWILPISATQHAGGPEMAPSFLDLPDAIHTPRRRCPSRRCSTSRTTRNDIRKPLYATATAIRRSRQRARRTLFLRQRRTAIICITRAVGGRRKRPHTPLSLQL